MFLIGTPRGMQTVFYEYFIKAKGDKKWFSYTAKASETKIVEQSELDQALKMMGKAKYDQEFECSWQGHLPGSIYTDEITDMEDEERMTAVPYDPSALVHTAWDIGLMMRLPLYFFKILDTLFTLLIAIPIEINRFLTITKF